MDWEGELKLEQTLDQEHSEESAEALREIALNLRHIRAQLELITETKYEDGDLDNAS